MIANSEHILIQEEVEAAFVALRSDGIIHYTFKPIEDLKIEHALEMFETVGRIGKAKKYPTLLTVNKYMNIESEVRQLWADSSVNKYASAEAMVLMNVAIKLIGNFYIQINKPVIPTQMFTSEKPALEWLKKFK